MCEKTEINQKLEDYYSCDKYCLLCRQKLDEACNFCLQKGIEDPKLCPRVWGKCGHIVHLHCVERWLQCHKVCPYPSDVCNWEIAEQF